MNEQLTTPQNSAVSIIQHAISTGADPAYLRELLAVRREWEADESRKAYYSAISEFQRRAPIIAKEDDAHGKKYAAMDRIWREIRPLMTELGLSITWQICELRDGVCHVEGEIAHMHGHGIRVTQDIPLPELIRGQNAAQQMGSASTYARRYALCAALGLVTGEDDDAHVAGTSYVTKEQADELALLVARAPDGTLDALLAWAECDSLADMPAGKFTKAVQTLKTKIKA